jgi:phage terminase large subunit-like protein
MTGPSRAETLARMAPQDAGTLIAALPEAEAIQLDTDWRFLARAEQIAPAGQWRTWLVMAGRGFGKTRAGAEWVRGLAEGDGRLRIALVAATMHEGRTVMIEGESGLIEIAPPPMRPRWEPSRRRLSWPNGAQAFLYSAAEPEMLRGPQHHVAWADEIAKWPNGEAVWSNLLLGLRLGGSPRVMATTTPRPVPLLRRILAGEGVHVTRGRMRDNIANLSTRFRDAVTDEYGGTRLGRQELDGELIEEAAGALWTRDGIEAARVRVAPELIRVVIGVDPPAGTEGDACGIVVVGLGADTCGYVLEDASIAGARPEGWARAVAAAAERHRAERVVAEANNGGAMVASVLLAAQETLPVSLVHATRGKAARAEPVSMLYGRGRVAHAGAFPDLEDQMCGLIAGGGYEGPGRSPDRADALVWALSELMLGRHGEPGVRRL